MAAQAEKALYYTAMRLLCGDFHALAAPVRTPNAARKLNIHDNHQDTPVFKISNNYHLP
ncbi:hypothetical protein [Conchiformibius kuhniae]|uniref:Uncharacterized protein n=1 Tax=Conchiformibius kuhniae TaxID=211502 RepID=A0A8T9MVC4_9NEIS|nr:hypothetical protein [Conchiformibius kuhniae]UOP05064.1 hypothetical protein LVJ77_01805 [Conchiformibius kuhniae]